MVVLIGLGTIIFFFMSSSLSPMMNLIGMGLLVFFALYAAIRPQSLFSLRSVDDRKLIFTPDEIIWGTVIMPVKELEKIEIYIHCFESFQFSSSKVDRKKIETVGYGDKNTINFTYRGGNHDLTFYLGDFVHYDTLVRIMQCWRERGIIFSARSLYPDSVIRENVNRVIQSPWP